MKVKEYIEGKKALWAENIDEFEIGERVLDQDGGECLITDKTANSIEVFIRKKSDKGVNAKNWFTMKNFNRRFKRDIA